MRKQRLVVAAAAPGTLAANTVGGETISGPLGRSGRPGCSGGVGQYRPGSRRSTSHREMRSAVVDELRGPPPSYAPLTLCTSTLAVGRLRRCPIVNAALKGV
jgi:hypothetical protein